MEQNKSSAVGRRSAQVGFACCAYVNGSRGSAEGVDGSDVAVLRTTVIDGGVSFGEAEEVQLDLNSEWLGSVG